MKMSEIKGHFTNRKVLLVLNVIFGLSLIGIPFFSGFGSKESIMLSAWNWALVNERFVLWKAIALLLTFLSIFLTAFYVTRQIRLTYSNSADNSESGQKLSPIFLLGPLAILGVCSLWFINTLSPVSTDAWILDFSNLPAVHGTSLVLIVTLILAVTGILLSYRRFPVRLGKETSSLTVAFNKISHQGLYLDKAYQAIAAGSVILAKTLDRFDRRVIDRSVDGIGISSVVLAKLLAAVDRFVIDGVVNIVAFLARRIGALIAKVQARRIQNQLVWMLLALIILLLIVLT